MRAYVICKKSLDSAYEVPKNQVFPLENNKNILTTATAHKKGPGRKEKNLRQKKWKFQNIFKTRPIIMQDVFSLWEFFLFWNFFADGGMWET